jgi:membrane protease YdiL (CAAX protease family)
MNADSRWNWWRFLGYTAIVGAAYMGSQFAAIFCAGVVEALSHPGTDLQEWGRRVPSNGFVLSLALCACLIVCAPLVWFLVKRVEDRPWSFLGFRPVPARAVLHGCAAMMVLFAAFDIGGYFLGRPPVAKFVLDVYDTSSSPAFLAFTVILAVPVLEELLFRGYLFGGLRACGMPVAAAVVLVSAVFGATHTQYDAYDVANVVLMGVLFAVARARFDSIVPSIAMHSLANTLSLVGVVWYRMHTG